MNEPVCQQNFYRPISAKLALLFAYRSQNVEKSKKRENYVITDLIAAKTAQYSSDLLEPRFISDTDSIPIHH